MYTTYRLLEPQELAVDRSQYHKSRDFGFSVGVNKCLIKGSNLSLTHAFTWSCGVRQHGLLNCISFRLATTVTTENIVDQVYMQARHSADGLN